MRYCPLFFILIFEGFHFFKFKKHTKIIHLLETVLLFETLGIKADKFLAIKCDRPREKKWKKKNQWEKRGVSKNTLLFS